MTDSMADKMAPQLRRESDLKELRQLITRLWGETDMQHTEVTNAMFEGIESAARQRKESTRGPA